MSNGNRDAERVTRDTRRETRDSRPPAPSPLLRITHHASRITAVLLLASSLAHADSLTDPTRPYAAVTKSSSPLQPVATGLRVTAIMQTGGHRVAVVDGTVVKPGDRVGDAVIDEVMSDGVRYKRAGKIEYARLPKQAVSVRNAAAREE